LYLLTELAGVDLPEKTIALRAGIDGPRWQKKVSGLNYGSLFRTLGRSKTNIHL
jgi:hypothetical protein